MGVLTATCPPDPTGVARHWAHSPEGLNAEYTFTAESGFIPGWQPSRYIEQGENYALALYSALVLGPCASPPTSGEVIYADDFDLGISALYWDLFVTSSDYTADFAFDYSQHGIGPAPNSVGGTTTGVKFTVNNNDIYEGTEALSAYPLGQYFDGDYVLKFDMWINYNGGSGGGSGSTEFMNAGINQAGTQVNWPENPRQRRLRVRRHRRGWRSAGLPGLHGCGDVQRVVRRIRRRQPEPHRVAVSVALHEPGI